MNNMQLHFSSLIDVATPYTRSNTACVHVCVCVGARICRNETENFLAKVKSMLTEARDRTAAGRCACAQLVETILIPRLKHWKGAGDAPKTFKYLLESAAACVYLQNDVRVRVCF